MATIQNEIRINAPMERIWEALADIGRLDQYDPTVKKCSLVTESRTGLGAKRRVEMLDGKNWFEEKVSIFEPMEALAFELTACSFPIESLTHSYSFEKGRDSVTVRQVMNYDVKFGFFGKILDGLMIKKQSDAGIKKFLSGLKAYTEKKS
jgi:ribosome-associated toxin RatA of RatAB toxin-antitoxin module